MKERPILFSGEMVRAILEGTKTQTRRVIAPVQPRDDGRWPAGRDPLGDCPFGQPGDRLWVRETWARLYPTEPAHLLYRADFEPRYGAWEQDDTPRHTIRVESWRPSIHMPRWASRITLELTSVRVERLQDISEEDAWTEGVTRVRGDLFGVEGLVPFEHHYPQDAFAALWHVVNPKHPWNSNPWVWVLGFKRVEAKGVAA
jgi:hypothetical protein